MQKSTIDIEDASDNIADVLEKPINNIAKVNVLATVEAAKDYVYSRKRLDNNAQGEYNSYSTDDIYTSTPNFARDVAEYDRREFPIRLREATKQMMDGEEKTIAIVVAKNVYIFEATGYMNGYLSYKFSTNNKEEWEKWKRWEEYDKRTNSDTEGSSVWIKSIQNNEGKQNNNNDVLGGRGGTANDARLSYEALERNGAGNTEQVRGYYHPKEEVNEILRKLRELHKYSRKYTPEEARAAIERVKSGEVIEAPKVKNFTMTTGALKKFISEFSKNKRYSKEIAKEITKAFEGVTMLKPEDIRNITELIWEGLNDYSDSEIKHVRPIFYC